MISNPVSPVTRAPIALDRGNVLRILDGRGTELTPASGVLWITEEGCANDTVLLPGDTHRIARTGLALALAHRPARVVLDVPPGASSPRCVELALADGGPGRRIALDNGRPSTLRALTTTIGSAMRKAVAAVRSVVKSHEPRPPTGGCFEHDSVYSSRRIRHTRHRHDARPWDDPGWSARDAASRHYPFPYY